MIRNKFETIVVIEKDSFIILKQTYDHSFRVLKQWVKSESFAYRIKICIKDKMLVMSFT